MSRPAAPSARRHRLAVGAAALGLSLGLASCSHDGREMRDPRPDQNQSIITTSTAAPTESTAAPAEVQPVVPAASDPSRPDDASLLVEGFDVALPWPEGGAIPRDATCDGADASPAIGWSGAPEGTAEIAVVVIDPDASDFVHLVVAGLDPAAALPQGSMPDGAIVGVNDNGTSGWTGPCPPDGETHTYRVEVHALGQQTELPSGVAADEMLRAIDMATIGLAIGSGTYARGSA